MKDTNNTLVNKSTQRLKYMQLVEYILFQIEHNNLQVNDRLPSLNQLTSELNISKETALKGLQYLTEKGMIEAEFRKGYYVKRLKLNQPYRVCLILDKMNILRDRIYNQFMETTGNQAEVDVFFHHHNVKVFTKLIEESLNNYTHFVIVTYFKENVVPILNTIPAHKRIIIDHYEKGLAGNSTTIYQDHSLDILESLNTLLPKIKKYKQLILVSPEQAYHAKELVKGFEKFTSKNNISCNIISKVEEKNFREGNVYITFNRYDEDDVSIIKLCRKAGFTLGSQIGLISYNDTAIKEVLENGITVISVDFRKIGEEAALAIINNSTKQLRIPAEVIERKSL